MAKLKITPPTTPAYVDPLHRVGELYKPPVAEQPQQVAYQPVSDVTQRPRMIGQEVMGHGPVSYTHLTLPTTPYV